MEAKAALAEGRKVLDRVLEPHGFRFKPGPAGTSSGGAFASGTYVRGDRRLEIHFRQSLGLVAYHLGDQTLSHEAYMWSVLGPTGGNAYPGFSTDALHGFRGLAEDLERHAREFLAGSDNELARRFVHAAAHPKPTGFKAITRQGREHRRET